MFVFETAGPECFCESSDIRVRCVGFEELPHGVVSWRPVMETDDFLDQGLPPVGSVVDSLGERVPGSIVSGVLGRVYELFGLDTTERAY